MSEAIGNVDSMADHWIPTSEAALQQAIANGTFEENHHVEAKREFATGSAKNKEMARDLAGLAIDGGVLIIGVAELKDIQSWRCEPLPLQGLGERIEQVVQQLIHSPLPVRARTFPAAGDPTLGYVAVEVPASPQAPHMVDNIYYARGEKTKRRLGDAEVRTYLAAHRDLGEQIHDLLSIVP
ncbi:Putative DNA-binding domain-containing protein [Glycomyces harbinensis]|uniref:Putative DNA-binding domain-containing protein n=2 Tax=Glycomyces harbinensis TaxID=58114 RepID=A0A1G6QU87_9ACTN|nr:Putative DNA-binding domain-containing protein [Glycomyces harbinensis]